MMIITIFWSLIFVFMVILSIFFVPAIGDLLKGPQFLFPFILFSFLGGILLFLTLKNKTKGKLRIFLLLTSLSSTGFFISIFLHNFFYALAILASDFAVIRFLFEVLHGIFFIIAVPFCPLGFLIGAVGSGLLIFKKNRIKK